MQTKSNIDAIQTREESRFPKTEPLNPPSNFHVLAKPTGSACNLACAYCFFLAKEALYPDSHFRMTDELLETYLKQYIEAQRGNQVTIAWQGGEPTLMGLDFFKRSVEIARRYARPEVQIEHTIQTNGTLLNDEWCAFFRENHFLVGLSIDGPAPLHNAYRVDKGGRPTFAKALAAARLLQKHQVDFNVLTTVHAANADHPLEVYHFLRDDLGAQWLQFIPIVERINTDGRTLIQEGHTVTDRSVNPERWGRFLITIFNEWVRQDVGRVYITLFEAALASWLGLPASLCIFDKTCGHALAIEHNGDVYSCDHFVEPNFLLGNIQDRPLIELVGSEKQYLFGAAKQDSLPDYCLSCKVNFACHGECPKNRFLLTPDGKPGLNYLCAGYKAFFTYIDKPMKIMASLYRSGRAPWEIMQLLSEENARLAAVFATAKRNDYCPCGSGKKFKQCHGKRL